MKGTSFIGFERADQGPHVFQIRDRHTGQVIEPRFSRSSKANVDEAVGLATSAFRQYRKLSGKRRAEFLRAIADSLERRKEQIVPRAMSESALPEARLSGELARTCGQLRMFASIVEAGSWSDVRIDPAQPNRQPLPAPDTRSMLRAIGPVAVFGASNFPLAFSVAGGDTASALAAGCSVIVKAHPAHPGTSEIAAEAVIEAAKSTGMPEGVFSLLFDDGYEIGEALVKHPGIKAVGFTGSQRGGLALWRIANDRPVPIPVYAEMGSVNPTIVLPGKLTAEFASGLHASATAGVGQFCTNPGLVITVGDAAAFRDAFVGKMTATPAGTMLTEGIAMAYAEGLQNLSACATALAPFTVPGAPAVMEVDASRFLRNPSLQEEVFGPATLLVACSDRAEALEVIRSLQGQLTGSIHGTDEEIVDAQEIVDELEDKVGRLIVNQFPTGLEVNASIVHGGPFPATTDSRTTSVGGRAILRWARPVCYQNFPAHLLPDELK